MAYLTAVMPAQDDSSKNKGKKTSLKGLELPGKTSLKGLEKFLEGTSLKGHLRRIYLRVSNSKFTYAGS